MSQDIENGIAGSRSQRLSKDPRFLAALEEAKAFAAEDEAAQAAPVAAHPAANAATGAAPAGELKDPDLTEKEGAGFWKEAGRTIVGGPVDAIREAANLMDQGAAAMQDLFYKMRFDTKEEAAAAKLANPVEPVFGPIARAITPDVAKSESLVGGATRSITQFLVPFLGAMKALKGVGGATNLATAGRAMTAGAATDFAAFDPHEKRMSNLIMDLSDNDPVVGKAVFEYLSAKDGDTAIEGRLKNALEGAGLGLAVEGVFAGVRGVRAHFRSRHGDAGSAVQTAAGRGFGDAAPANTGGRLKLEVDGTSADEAVPTKAPRTPNEADVLDLGEEVARRKALGQPTLETITKPRTPATEAPRFKSADDMGGARAPRTPDPETSAITRMDTVVADLEARGADGARRAWIDPEDMSIIFTKERPVGAIDLDTKVKAAMEAAPGTRTAEDLIAIRAYRQAQEAAFPGIVRADLIGGSGREMDTALRAEALNAARPRASGGGKAAIDDATRAEIREEGKRAAGADVRAANKSAMNERALREAAEDEVARVLANASEIGKVAAKSQYGGKIILSEGGFVSPTLLVHMASAGAGAAGGFAMSDDDDSWAERLSNAGMGAMAGLGVKVAAKKGASTVSDMMKGKSAAQAAKEADLESLARRVTEGIAPRPEKGVQMPKKSPSFTTAKVEGMVTALRTGDYDSIGKMLDEPDFNLANLDTEEEVDAVINAFSAAFTKETKVATRGVQSLVMTEELAKDLGATPKSLLELYRGTDNMAAKVVAHRSLLAGSATKVTAMARHVMANPHDMDLMLALRKQVAVHAAIQARMKGVQSEVARALSSFRIKATAVDLLGDERAALIDAMGGAAANVEFAKKLSMLADPRAVNAASRKSALARTPDALFEAWVNGILSGPATHAVNVLGNTTVLGMGIVEKGLGAVIGKLRNGSDAIGSREVMTTVKGMVEGFKDAMHINMAGTGHLADAARRFAVGDLAGAERVIMESADLGSVYKSAVSGQAQTDSQVFSAMELLANKPTSISSAAFNLQDGSFIGGAVDYLGAVVRTPGRMLAAGDEMFKAINYRGELRAQAYRKAQDEGLEGAEFAARVAGLLDEPLPEMSKEALDAARKMTFTNPLGESGQALQRFIHTTPGVRYIAPFVRTPANILNFTFDRTPGLNMLAKRNRDAFAAGGRKRDMMLARTAMGGALYMLGWDLHQRGIITGGGDKQKGAERLAGQQQYSLKVGDQYIAFNRFDPIGIVLGLAADMHDLSGNMEEVEMQELAGAAMLSIQRNLISKSYLQGVMSLMMAVGNPEMYGEKFVQNFAGSLVPAIVNAARKNEDPVIREVWTMVDAIKNRIPGYSTEIPPHLNLLGEEVTYGKGLGVGVASPIMVKDENPSPLAQEVARLNLDLKHPPRTLSGGDGAPGIDLTPEQYYALMKVAGARFKQLGEAFVTSGAYATIPESDDPTSREYTNAKQFVIRRMWQTSMQEARARLIADDKDLMRKFQRTRDNARRVLQGLPVLPVNEN